MKQVTMKDSKDNVKKKKVYDLMEICHMHSKSNEHFNIFIGMYGMPLNHDGYVRSS